MINISKLYCGRSSEGDHLRYSKRNSFGPVVVYNCTSRCNLRCSHCYSSSNSAIKAGELSTLEVRKLLSELAELNCAVVLFSGGEPLLRGDLFELLAEAKHLGVRTVVSSNGTLIDSAVADKLVDVGVSYVGISIDGEEKFHDKFRKVKGCFKAALAGIEHCKAAGLKTGLRFTITKANAEQVGAVFDIAVSMDVRRICFYHLIRTGRAKELDNQTLLSQQSRAVVDTIIEKTDEFVGRGLVDEVLTVGNHADGPFLLARMTQENNRRYEEAEKLLRAGGGNKIGESIVCVSWDGNVHPDQFWRNYSLGNVKDKSFEQIWEDSSEPVLKKLRDKAHFADQRCLCCRWFDLCKGNWRFLGTEIEAEHWLNEPACYLTDEEIL